MGALLMFPNVCRDYTDQFQEWRQQTFNSLPSDMKDVITNHEKDWDGKWEENKQASPELMASASQVNKNIWIGSADSAESRPFLRENDIHVILNMAEECLYESILRSVQVVRIGIEDGKLTNVGVFEKAAEVIGDAVSKDENILIHCAAGVSRSATAVCAYFMLYEEIGWAQAIAIVRQGRSCINPHPLLVRALIRDLGNKFIP